MRQLIKMMFLGLLLFSTACTGQEGDESIVSSLQAQILDFTQQLTTANQEKEQQTGYFKQASDTFRQQIESLQGQIDAYVQQSSVYQKSIQDLQLSLEEQKAADLKDKYQAALQDIKERDYVIQKQQEDLAEVTKNLSLIDQYKAHLLPIWSHKYYYLAEATNKRAYESLYPYVSHANDQYVKPSFNNARSQSKIYYDQALEAIYPHISSFTNQYGEPIGQVQSRGRELYRTASKYSSDAYNHPTTQQYVGHANNLYSQAFAQIKSFLDDMEKIVDVQAQNLVKEFPELQPFVNKEVIGGLVTFIFSFPIVVIIYIGLRKTVFSRKRGSKQKKASSQAKRSKRMS